MISDQYGNEFIGSQTSTSKNDRSFFHRLKYYVEYQNNNRLFRITNIVNRYSDKNISSEQVYLFCSID